MLFDEEINELNKIILIHELIGTPLSTYADIRKRWYYLITLKDEIKRYIFEK